MTDDPPLETVDPKKRSVRYAPRDTRSWLDKLIDRLDPWVSRWFQGRRP